jgi:signal transduction histidine kinase
MMPAQRSSQAPGRPPAGAMQLLLVEDNPGDVELACERLSTAPGCRFEVTCVSRLQDAIRVLEQSHVDVVILDLSLPDSTGIDTLRQLQRRRPDVAIVVFSGGTGEELRRLALREGAQDFIDKSEPTTRLLARIMLSAFERQQAWDHHREVEQLISASPDALIVADAQGIVRFANAAATELLDRGLAELVDRPLDPELAQAPGTQAEIIRKDGRRRVEIRVSPCIWDHRPARLVSLHDITGRTVLDEQRLQAQRLEAIGQLTGGIAHDFNNILTVISGMIELLADAVAHDRRLASFARMIADAALRGADLTRHLLAFARKQPLQPRLTDVNVLVVTTSRLLRPTLGEQIEIESMLADEAWPAVVDPSQLTTALLNLAVNARDAMRGGGKLTFETGNVTLDEARGEGVPPGPYVMIAVSDTGSGMAPTVRERAFEPFFTTKEVGRGTGLGLSMVYGFVKQSDGHIQIDSQEGHGTTVKIYLPRGGGAAAAESEPETAPPGRSESILVVEDDALVRSYVVTQLESLGYRTVAAANAAEGLQAAAAGAFDLLFTDIIMPGDRNGLQLAKEVRRLQPGIRVLFTSGYAESVLVDHGDLDPGALLLNKPYRKLDLARSIRAALDADPDGSDGTRGSRPRRRLRRRGAAD